MTTTDKIAQNTTILVLSRLAMLATPILITMVGVIFWGRFENVASAASMAAETASTLNIRVNTLETNQTIGRADRIRYQDQVLDQLQTISATQVEQGKQIAALIALQQAQQGKANP